MYNNETATNNITKNTIYLLTHFLYLSIFLRKLVCPVNLLAKVFQTNSYKESSA